MAISKVASSISKIASSIKSSVSAQKSKSNTSSKSSSSKTSTSKTTSANTSKTSTARNTATNSSRTSASTARNTAASSSRVAASATKNTKTSSNGSKAATTKAAVAVKNTAANSSKVSASITKNTTVNTSKTKTLSTINRMSTTATKNITSVAATVKKSITSKNNMGKTTVISINNTVKNAVKNIANTVTNFVSAVNNKIANTIKNKSTNVSNTAKNNLTNNAKVSTVAAKAKNLVISKKTIGKSNTISIDYAVMKTINPRISVATRQTNQTVTRQAVQSPTKKQLSSITYAKKYYSTPLVAVNSVNGSKNEGIITDEELEMYENDKMAPAAYSHLMNLTYQWYLADSESSRNTYEQWANDFRDTGYTSTNGSFKSVDENIKFMPSRPSGSITEEQHYFRNKLNLNFSWADYQKLQERLPEDMKWDDSVASGFHQNNKVNDKDNRKYVSFDGHFELIYNDNNVLQTQYNNSDDMGTYNYYGPDDFWGHATYDVDPYGLIPGFKKWGNTPQ